MNSFVNRKKIDFVFIDWFGVLSNNYYWCVQSQQNKLLKDWCDSIFDDSEVLNQWMRGKYSLEYLADFRVKVEVEFIRHSFAMDIGFYKPDFTLMEVIDKLFPRATKFLVTDNMILFDHILKEYPSLNSYFNRLYLSYEIGLLKNDHPKSLFDHILEDQGLSNFNNCLLIDDNQHNCENFKKKGGRTILID